MSFHLFYVYFSLFICAFQPLFLKNSSKIFYVYFYHFCVSLLIFCVHFPFSQLKSSIIYLKLNLENDVFEPYKETEDGTYSPSGTYTLCQSLHLSLSLSPSISLSFKSSIKNNSSTWPVALNKNSISSFLSRHQKFKKKLPSLKLQVEIACFKFQFEIVSLKLPVARFSDSLGHCFIYFLLYE